MSYGPLLWDIFRRSAESADRIVKGANPAELPVEQPTQVPIRRQPKGRLRARPQLSPTLLSLADEVIE